jgi:hypothetical protein
MVSHLSGLIVESKSTSISCPRCARQLPVAVPHVNHRSITCAGCGAACLVLSRFALDIDRSPLELKRFIQWSQKELDELEFLTLLAFLSELLVFTDQDR